MAAALKEAQACNMRADGMTFLEIAQRMGVSESTAERLVERGMDRIVCPDAKRARQRELRHLERVRRALWGNVGDDCTAVLADDPSTAMALVKVSESIRKLLGLDAPAKLDATVRDKPASDYSIEELREMLREAKG